MEGETVTILKTEYEMLLAVVEQVSTLNKRITELEEEIRLLKNGRNSKTSSTPPSQDIGRSNKNSLRERSGRKSGGQKGHFGHTLQKTETPDEIITHGANYCQKCGAQLNMVPGTVKERRQEIEIVMVKRYVEHQRLEKECPCCNAKNTGDFPLQVTAPVQYGASVKELVAYLSVYQYVPYNRIKDMFAAVFNLPLSEGTVDTLLQAMSKKCDLPYQEIKRRIENSAVVGSDETGCHVDGKKHWIYIWQNDSLTYIVPSCNRDYKTIAGEFPEGLPNATIVSDCLSAQLKTPGARHQLCTDHLLRELSNFELSIKDEWSVKLKAVLKQAKDLKRRMTKDDFEKPPPDVTEIERRVDALLSVDYTHFHRKIRAFIKRLIKHRGSILTFLHYAEVPADNNGSERGIRNIKVKTKVSGQFRNALGAERFARIRSVIDTAIKNGQPVFPALSALACF